MREEIYTNVDADALLLLKTFLDALKQKTIGYFPARHIAEAIQDLENYPHVPMRNFVVLINVNELLLSIIYTDYKIELSDNLILNSNESYQRFCFSYERGGDAKRLGTMPEFKTLLFMSLKNSYVTDIIIREEE